jgi:DNA-binding IclR family transcriptional regulator
MMRAVGRTLAVFDCFSEDLPSLSLQAIANRVRLPKSTTFRLVQSLDEAGYLVRLDNQEYCLSFKFVRLAGLVKTNLDIRRIARSVLEEAARASGETVTLNTARGRERVCIDVVDTPSPLMSIAKPGEHRPLVDGATAKLLLAYLPRSESKDAVNFALRISGQRRSELLAELDRVRRQGYAVTHGERVLGLTAVAAPVRDTEEDGKYCIAIAGPTARMKPRISEHVRIAVRAGDEVSRRLGARSRDAGVEK